MPFVANTPESYLGRSDSLNPSSTCRGITSNGKPCRRPVEITPGTRRSRVKTPDLSDESAYCWQHKEQANLASAKSSPGPRRTTRPILEERTSIDTLADRLGLIDLASKPERKPGQGRYSDTFSDGEIKPPQRPEKKRNFFSCCCFTIPLDDIAEEPQPPPRPQPHPVQATTPAPGRTSKPQRPSPSGASSSKNSYRSRKKDGSQTANVKALIPGDLDAATAAALTTELARPFVDSEEAGFIYMFWLTPVSDKAPPVDAARSLLAPPSRGSARSRRPSDVVSRYAAGDKSDGAKSKTMLLKIGRAQNVQRRMNQWQRQCGYDIEMLRYYPYLPSASESSGTVPRMTPHAHRVERLIHIELGGMGLRAKQDKCEACGTNHREWFEVEATRDGIRTVDGIIRRWVDWDEASP